MKSRTEEKQLPLPMPKPRVGWGGKRVGAGRQPLPPELRKGLPHRSRPFHERDQPVHVTMRLVRGLPSLRRAKLARAIGDALRAGGRRRRGFRVVHLSVQSNHLHFIVEGLGRRTLGGGIRGLAIRIARAVNRELGRRGRVFADRYHARPLTTPRETRSALVYVLTNYKHHGRERHAFDPWSSAWWFGGWTVAPPPTGRPSPVVAPATWLLRRGWRRYGLLSALERPAGYPSATSPFSS